MVIYWKEGQFAFELATEKLRGLVVEWAKQEVVPERRRGNRG